MKKIIRISFHSMVSQELKMIIMDLLGNSFTPIETKDYDYYIAMETIYHNRNAMMEFLNSKNDAIRIMYCGESIYPDMNLFDYAVWHNDYYSSKDRIIYEPLMNTEKGYIFDESIVELDNSKKNISSFDILHEKTKFCNFLYSNPNSHYMRDELFYQISKYKKVDSLGKHLNNVDVVDTRNAANWAKLSIDIRRPYKFSIAAENASFAGYTTEKLVCSMMANTIPIYFGNPNVDDNYNTKSFINVSDFKTINDCVGYIAEIDNDDALWCSIMDQPWRTNEQIEKYNNDVDTFYKTFLNIFECDIEEARRRPRGCWPDYLYPTIFQWKDELKSTCFRGFLKKTADRLLSVLR